MKMSTKGRYGMRLMLELTQNYAKGPTLVDVMAKNQGISKKYIHLLATGLKTAGLVRAVRGPNGGYALARNPSAITAWDIVRALEGKTILAECIEDPTLCSRWQTCATRDLWREVASAMQGALTKVTLDQLAKRQHAKEDESIHYHI